MKHVIRALMALAMMMAGAAAQADTKLSNDGPAALLVFEFPSGGPWGEELAGALRWLAEDIAAEQGLVWKVWTEAPDRGVAGGVYLFGDWQTARAYVEKHSARLAEIGVTGIDVWEFSVNEPLSIVTRGR